MILWNGMVWLTIKWACGKKRLLAVSLDNESQSSNADVVQY